MAAIAATIGATKSRTAYLLNWCLKFDCHNLLSFDSVLALSAIDCYDVDKTQNREDENRALSSYPKA